jgi:hypothetical protein
MEYILTNYWILFAAGWYIIMGLLHDIFVIKNHKGSYDRELLRLLMDGHVLILSGALLVICFLMMQNNIQYACTLTVIVGTGMLIYCSMIFPFLKSFVTMFISLMVIIVGVKYHIQLP